MLSSDGGLSFKYTTCIGYVSVNAAKHQAVISVGQLDKPWKDEASPFVAACYGGGNGEKSDGIGE